MLDVPSNDNSCLELQPERSDYPSEDHFGVVNSVLGLPPDKGVAAHLEGMQYYVESGKFPDVPSGMICTHGVGSVSRSVISLSTGTMVGEAHNTRSHHVPKMLGQGKR